MKRFSSWERPRVLKLTPAYTGGATAGMAVMAALGLLFEGWADVLRNMLWLPWMFGCAAGPGYGFRRGVELQKQRERQAAGGAG